MPFDLSALMQDPGFVTGLGMLGSQQTPGAAFQGALGTANANQEAQQKIAMQRLLLGQAQARQNLNPSQYLLSNEQANASPQAAGPATQAALAGTPGGANIAANTQTPYQPPQGAIGNVDMQGLLGGALKAGMSPEEAQQMAGVIDPMTAMKMRLMGDVKALGPGASLANGMGQTIATNNNLPPDSQAAQVMNLTRVRDSYAPGQPGADPAKFASMDAALQKANGTFDQQLKQVQLADLQSHRGVEERLAQSNQELAQGQRNIENNFHVQQQAQGLQAQVQKMTIPQTEETLSKMEDLLNKYPEGKLPGFGKVDNTMANHGMGFLLSQEAQSVRQTMQPLQNMELHSRNGARITPLEVTNLQKEMGTGDYVSEARLRQGVATIRQMLNAQKSNLAAGTPQNVLDQYEAAGGVPLGRGAAAPAQQPAPVQIAPADALAEARRRGLIK